jgi:hypothetical protein
MAARFRAMSLPGFIEIHGRSLRRELVALPRAQTTPAAQQPALFASHEDHRLWRGGLSRAEPTRSWSGDGETR